MATKTKDPEVEEAASIDTGSEPNWDEEADMVKGAAALDAIIAAKVEEQVAAILSAQAAKKAQEESKPPLAMKADIADRFITESNARGSTQPWLKHYRCDRAMSEKMVEYDMELMDSYERGELERPHHEGKPNRKVAITDLCVIPGQWISWVNGHCYAYTENQVRNVERVRKLAEEHKPGGMEGIYEDTGVGALWPCPVCTHVPAFLDKQTYANHMWAVHQQRTA